VDTDCFQRFLDEFSQAHRESINIIQVDNGRFHRGKKLVIPENVVLLFQPPYCPELNPIERLWEHIKSQLKWSTFQSLEELESRVIELFAQLTPETIASIVGFPFILDA
jgi:transposase